MGQVLIQQYLNHLQDLRKVSGTHRESVVGHDFSSKVECGIDGVVEDAFRTNTPTLRSLN